MPMNFYTAGDGTGGVRSNNKTEKRDGGVSMQTGQSMWQPGPNYGWVHTELEPKVVDYLWKIIRKGEEANDNYKQRLAGNVSNSLGIIDEDDYFQKTVLFPLVEIFRKNNGG